MGKTDPSAPTYTQQSMVLVPMDTPGLTVVRDLMVFGYNDREGHCELRFDDVRVPTSNLLGEEGGGFAMAQARLGPGRIHHCMRCIGIAERALELMCRRVTRRVAFGKALAEQGVIQEWIADSRIEIEQARLLTMKAAWLMDTVGNKGARVEISAIKVVAPNMALRVVDRAIQAHGGAGVSQDTPLAAMWAGLRTLRFADGPDEVHRMQLARRELRPYAELDDGGPSSGRPRVSPAEGSRSGLGRTLDAGELVEHGVAVRAGRRRGRRPGPTMCAPTGAVRNWRATTSASLATSESCASVIAAPTQTSTSPSVAGLVAACMRANTSGSRTSPTPASMDRAAPTRISTDAAISAGLMRPSPR